MIQHKSLLHPVFLLNWMLACEQHARAAPYQSSLDMLTENRQRRSAEVLVCTSTTVVRLTMPAQQSVGGAASPGRPSRGGCR